MLIVLSICDILYMQEDTQTIFWSMAWMAQVNTHMCQILMQVIHKSSAQSQY